MDLGSTRLSLLGSFRHGVWTVRMNPFRLHRSRFCFRLWREAETGPISASAQRSEVTSRCSRSSHVIIEADKIVQGGDDIGAVRFLLEKAKDSQMRQFA